MRAAGAGAAGAPPARGRREAILDTALDLMAERGASATSMRALAAACGLNVAALYHYFPSKDALLRAVIEERSYATQLAQVPVPDLRLPAPERLAAFVLDLWEGALGEAAIWRLLLSEALHGDATAREVGEELRTILEDGLAHSLPRLLPELAVDTAVAARLVSGALLALLVEASLVGPETTRERAGLRARDLAVALLGPSPAWPDPGSEP